MAVNYGKVNQVEVPIAAAAPVVASFLEHVNMFSATRHAAIDLVNATLFLPHRKGRSVFVFAWDR